MLTVTTYNGPVQSDLLSGRRYIMFARLCAMTRVSTQQLHDNEFDWKTCISHRWGYNSGQHMMQRHLYDRE